MVKVLFWNREKNEKKKKNIRETSLYCKQNIMNTEQKCKNVKIVQWKNHLKENILIDLKIKHWKEHTPAGTCL